MEEDYFVYHEELPFEKELYTFEELLNGPFTYLSYEQQKAIDKRLRKVEQQYQNPARSKNFVFCVLAESFLVIAILCHRKVHHNVPRK